MYSNIELDRHLKNAVRLKQRVANGVRVLKPKRIAVCAVREPLEFIVDLPSNTGNVTSEVSLLRAPEGSETQLDGRKLRTLDTGLYQISVTIPGGFSRTNGIAALPGALFEEFPFCSQKAVGADPREIVEALLNDDRLTTERIIECIEAPNRGPVCGLGDLFAPDPVHWKSYGAP